jgi:C_GCAxxG_C_C family probable redox protein
VLTAFGSEFGLPDDLALKIAAPFGAGMARSGKTCGAVTGGLMALGLKYGYTALEGRDETYAIAQAFMYRFEVQHGSLVCKDLVGFDLINPENLKLAQQSGVFETVCPALVRDAVGIVQDLLAKKP